MVQPKLMSPITTRSLRGSGCGDIFLTHANILVFNGQKEFYLMDKTLERLCEFETRATRAC